MHTQLFGHRQRTVILIRTMAANPHSVIDVIGQHLVNKPLQAAGMSADNVHGGEIVRKMNIWPRSEASRANVKF